MRIPFRKKTVRSRVSYLASQPAPTLGWNARDQVAGMKSGYAIHLENFFPSATDVMLRKGKSDHVTGIGAQVESLMAYNTPAGTQTLFAAAGTDFYNVTSAGAVGAAVVSGLTNARWQHLNYTNSSGTSYLCCFNGTDSPRYWDNASWITITGASTPAITGLTTSDIVSAAMHKRRMWLVQKNSLKAWYLPVDAVGGAANALDLSGIAKRGGYIMAIDTWTLDAGEGIDDYWVAVTSEGEVIVYGGTDPSSGSTWVIKGVWYIGEPIGRRCLMKFGGDLLLLLVNGVWPLSKALLSAAVDPRVAITDLISPAMNLAAVSYKANFGWQLAVLPSADMLLLNVPVSEGSEQQQYVMNVLTGAWCHFTGWEGNCFELLDGELYMGGNGVVEKVWDTFTDNASSNIVGNAKTAFDYFKSQSKKSFKMARPTLMTDGTPTVEIGINVDYDNGENFGTLTFTPSSSALWGVSLWGIGLWGSGLQTLRNWIGLSGIGLCAAVRLKIASQGLEIRWQATDVLYEPGTALV